jgi:hypothetical protein
MRDLKCAEAKRDANFSIEARIGPREQGLQLMVEANLPTEHAKHERRGKMAVGGRKSVDGFAAQQIVGVRLPTLDSEQNLKSGFPRCSHGGHGGLA